MISTHLQGASIAISLVGAAVLASATTAFAQTTTATTTPGVPNTGAGGDPATLLAILGIAAVVVVVGGAYLLWERSTT
jgi:hypothetical protein